MRAETPPSEDGDLPLGVAGWKGEIAKARDKLPDPKATFWDTLRRDFIEARDEANESAAQDLIEQSVAKITDPAKASQAWKYATGQATLLAPLVTAWKGSMKLAQKTVDQQHRDVMRMADHFVSLEELEPQKIKAWTDKLMKEARRHRGLERLGNGCRSFLRARGVLLLRGGLGHCIHLRQVSAGNSSGAPSHPPPYWDDAPDSSERKHLQHPADEPAHGQAPADCQD